MHNSRATGRRGDWVLYVGSDIWRFLVLNLPHVTHPEPRMLRQPLNIWKICSPLQYKAYSSVVINFSRDSSVGLATRYGAGQSGDRIPVGARFSAPVQTGLGAHPASCTMGNGSFPRVKLPGAWRWSSTPSSTEVKERVELYLYSSSGPSWSVTGSTVPLPLAGRPRYPGSRPALGNTNLIFKEYMGPFSPRR